MRVDYTLPALQLGTLQDASPTPEDAGGASFRELVRGEAVQLPATVDQQLRLDARPFTATYIGPPPKPPSLEMGDATSQRSRWRSMLWRHVAVPSPGTSVSTSGGAPVQAMLMMLQNMQDLEDLIVSQSVAVTRG